MDVIGSIPVGPTTNPVVPGPSGRERRGFCCTVEHVGSTSVPGLASKPVIDIVLLVKDSAAEETYIPQLETVGFLHHLREPGWFEHRLLNHKVHEVNLHVFTAGCEEATRMIRFRDYLRSDQDARIEYEQLKRRLADQDGLSCRTTQTPRVQQSVPSWLNSARAPYCRWLSLVFPLWNMW
ncbi:GrpB family protein [Pseudarthrobacter cellobiosi]|uniref:GrpB family protein n=1 Tax=Pseudarthrobacter cellobiosi TaxID=2953654 RepID=UPI0035ABBD10